MALKCPRCGLVNTDDLTECRRCNTSLAGVPFTTAETRTTGALPAGQAGVEHAERRYRDGYSLARGVIQLGAAIKVIAVLVAALFALLLIVGYGAGSRSGEGIGLLGLVVGLAFTATVGLVIFVAGAVLSGIGQLVQAQLDTAVGNSPLLSPADRARVIMGS